MEEQEHGISLENFLKWAAELGISDSPTRSVPFCLGHSLSLAYFPHAGGRGLGAARDLRKGEVILRVPKSALMTIESLLKDDKLSVAVNRHPYLSSVQILTACLIYEIDKGKSSRWLPYLMHLPRNYDIIATFGEFEKQALQVADAIWAAEKAISKAKAEWKEAHQLMEELNLKPQLLTLRAWLWAAATVR